MLEVSTLFFVNPFKTKSLYLILSGVIYEQGAGEQERPESKTHSGTVWKRPSGVTATAKRKVIKKPAGSCSTESHEQTPQKIKKARALLYSSVYHSTYSQFKVVLGPEAAKEKARAKAKQACKDAEKAGTNAKQP